MNIIKQLKKLRIDHFECEDRFYSCPKSRNGCYNDCAGNSCDCGADNHNARINKIISYINTKQQRAKKAKRAYQAFNEHSNDMTDNGLNTPAADNAIVGIPVPVLDASNAYMSMLMIS
jgi:hypothetical protein